jgi:HSP20 family molecular chaperone IbpA
MTETTIPAKSAQKGDLATTREESRYLVPAVDIYETSEGLVVVADLPGVDKDDVSVRVENSILTIQGKSAWKPLGTAFLEEFGLMGYFRQFELPGEVDQGKIGGEFKNGVLTIRLPKAEKAKPVSIQVKAN